MAGALHAGEQIRDTGGRSCSSRARTGLLGGNQVASSPHGRDRDVGRGRIPGNRARILLVLTVVVILVVIFGYMLVVSQVGNG
jgi:hypothetical protein